MGSLEKPEHIALSTGLIIQSPAVSIPPPDGHIPLPLPGQRKPMPMPPPLMNYYNTHMPMPMPMGIRKRKKGRHYNAGMPPPPPIMDSFASAAETDEEARKLLLWVQFGRNEANAVKSSGKRNL